MEELETELMARDEELSASAAKLAAMEKQLSNMAGLSQQVAEGQHALQLAAAETSTVGEELSAAQAGLSERQLALESAHAAVAEKDRRIRELEVGGWVRRQGQLQGQHAGASRLAAGWRSSRRRRAVGACSAGLTRMRLLTPCLPPCCCCCCYTRSPYMT